MNEQIFLDGVKDLGIELSERQAGQFRTFSQLLVEWNEKMNLTAIVDDDGIATKHFLDSLLLFKAVDVFEGARVIDIGTGAGFPGVPLKIARPDIRLTLLDSLNKRLVFLGEVIRELELSDVECVHMRAEDGAKKAEYNGGYDVAVSRAVAKMDKLCGYCLPYVKPGGVLAAYKSSGAADEIDAARGMIKRIGGEVEVVHDVPLPGTDIIRSIVVVKKVR